MGLDLKKMREQQSRIHSAAGGGDDRKWLYSEKLKAEDYVKPMPDVKGTLNGGYYVEQIIWWVNGKMYLSNATFNKDCVIQEEYDKAKKIAESDKEMKAILEAKNPQNKAPLLQRQTRFLAPVLHLSLEFDSNDEESVEKCDVVDDMVKIFVIKPKLMDDYHRVITSKTVNKKGGWGAMAQKTGSILQVGREGTGLNTQYHAQFFEKMEDDEVWDVLATDKYYTEEAIPDVWKLTKDLQKSDDYLRGVIRNYLYGEDMPEDASRSDNSETTDEEDKPSTKSEKPKVEKPASRKQTVEEDDEEDAPKAKRVRNTTAQDASPAKERSLLDDVESELNDLD